jgi:predicted Zn finger-like uncharacterized protein
MLELVATSKQLKKQRRLSIKDGDVLLVGRSPKDGWSVPWDSKISRVHVELLIKQNKVIVRRLDGARNEVHYKGKPSTRFTMALGDQFRIGATTFVVNQSDESVSKFGQRLGHFSIRKAMGNGPLGDLVGAVDTKTGRSVTVKVLHPDLLSDSVSIDRFFFNADKLAGCKLGGVVLPNETGRVDEHLFFAREFIQGSDLAKLIKDKGKFGSQRAHEIVQQLARHLAELQRVGICHGNLTPSNVISRVGVVRLVDCSMGCSVAKRIRSMPEKETSFVNYLAPELAESPGKLSIFSDMYALGCLWFEMLAGEPPFPLGNLDVRLASHAKLEPQWSRLQGSGADVATIDVMRQLLSKNPDRRFSSADELLETINSKEVQGAFVECESCQKRYRIKGSMYGKKVRCKQCGESITIPNQL